MTISLSYGLPAIVFGGEGALPDRFEGTARAIHGIVGTGLAAVVALHIAAGLYHAFKRDGVMGRMGLRR
jgi:cytochrome b561